MKLRESRQNNSRAIGADRAPRPMIFIATETPPALQTVNTIPYSKRAGKCIFYDDQTPSSLRHEITSERPKFSRTMDVDREPLPMILTVAETSSSLQKIRRPTLQNAPENEHSTKIRHHPPPAVKSREKRQYPSRTMDTDHPPWPWDRSNPREFLRGRRLNKRY